MAETRPIAKAFSRKSKGQAKAADTAKPAQKDIQAPPSSLPAQDQITHSDLPSIVDMAKTRPIAKAISRKKKGRSDAVYPAEQAQENSHAPGPIKNHNGSDDVVIISDKAIEKGKVVDNPQNDEDVVMSEDVVFISERPALISDTGASKQNATDATQQETTHEREEATKIYDGDNIQEESNRLLKRQVASAPSPLEDVSLKRSVLFALQHKNEAALVDILAQCTKSGEEVLSKTAALTVDQGVLCYAIENGTETQIKMILSTLNVSLNGNRSANGSALALAAKIGNVQLVSNILRLGCSIQIGFDRGGGDALHAAAAAGQSVTLEVLLRAGMPANVQGGEFGSPLQAAICSGRPFSDVACVSQLLRYEADVNARGGKHGTALLATVSRGRPILLDMVLKTGRVNRNVIDEALTAANEALEAARGGATDEQKKREKIPKKMVKALKKAARKKVAEILARADNANDSAGHLEDVDEDEEDEHDTEASNRAAVPTSTNKIDWTDMGDSLYD